MATVLKKKTAPEKTKSISKREISERLVELDLAQTSAIRDLEMDISEESGIDSKTVLAAARKAIT
jgi:hypothetical protein